MPHAVALMHSAPQHRRVVTERPHPFDKRRGLFSRGLRIARQDPQEPTRRFTDDRPCVVVGAIEHPVIAEEERPEERHFQLCTAAVGHDPCATVGASRAAARPAFAAGIADTDKTVFPLRILGRHAVASALEAVFIPRELVPSADVAIEIDGFRGLRNVCIPAGRRRGLHILPAPVRRPPRSLQPPTAVGQRYFASSNDSPDTKPGHCALDQRSPAAFAARCGCLHPRGRVARIWLKISRARRRSFDQRHPGVLYFARHSHHGGPRHPLRMSDTPGGASGFDQSAPSRDADADAARREHLNRVMLQAAAGDQAAFAELYQLTASRCSGQSCACFTITAKPGYPPGGLHDRMATHRHVRPGARRR